MVLLRTQQQYYSMDLIGQECCNILDIYHLLSNEVHTSYIENLDVLLRCVTSATATVLF